MNKGKKVFVWLFKRRYDIVKKKYKYIQKLIILTSNGVFIYTYPL